MLVAYWPWVEFLYVLESEEINKYLLFNYKQVLFQTPGGRNVNIGREITVKSRTFTGALENLEIIFSGIWNRAVQKGVPG